MRQDMEEVAKTDVVTLREELAAAKRQIEMLQESVHASQAFMEPLEGHTRRLSLVLSAPTPNSKGLRAKQQNLWGVYSSAVTRKPESACCASPTRGARELAKKLADIPS